jgi:nitrite reductase/ring-hydroxylating ferredoxin subunit
VAWYRIFPSVDAAKNKIADNEMQLVKIKGKMIFLTRCDNKFYAADNDCPHQGGFLNEGKISFRKEVVCPWHGYRFNLETGAEASGKNCPALTVYEVKEAEDGLFIKIDI